MNSPLPDGVTLGELAPGYPALLVHTPACTATLALHGAHLTHWQPRQATHPVLYNSPTAVYREGKAIRGGVPLCWPWFNAHPTAPERHPSHGVARNRFWEVTQAEFRGADLHLFLSLPPSAEIAAHFPSTHEVSAHFTLGETCKIELKTTNLSPDNLLVGGALHTYLAVSNIEDVSVTGLQNTPYLDTTYSPEGQSVQAEKELLIAQEVDRIYTGTANCIILDDRGHGRRLGIEKSNSLTTVIWNPWREKATALADLPDEGYRDFLCIEASNARQDARIIPPGESHTLCTEIRIIPED